MIKTELTCQTVQTKAQEQSKGKRRKGVRGKREKGRGRRTKQRWWRWQERKSHEEGGQGEGRDGISISLTSRWWARLTHMQITKEKIMTLERRKQNLTMELGGEGQGMREHQRMTISGVPDGWTEWIGRDGQRERFEQKSQGWMVQAVFIAATGSVADGVWWKMRLQNYGSPGLWQFWMFCSEVVRSSEWEEDSMGGNSKWEKYFQII